MLPELNLLTVAIYWLNLCVAAASRLDMLYAEETTPHYTGNTEPIKGCFGRRQEEGEETERGRGVFVMFRALFGGGSPLTTLCSKGGIDGVTQDNRRFHNEPARKEKKKGDCSHHRHPSLAPVLIGFSAPCCVHDRNHTRPIQ